MEKNAWQHLGIAATQDPKVIRRAYARQAKKLHPEEHPQQFQALRDAYEQALAQAHGGAKPKAALLETSPEQQEEPSPTLTQTPVEAAFARFWEKQARGDQDEALQQLSRWWFNPSLNPQWQYQFNRLLLDAVLDQGIQPKILAELVWTLYWPRDDLKFEVMANNRRKFMFREKIRQALEVGLWDVRFEFNKHLAQGDAAAAFSYLESVWHAPEFDHVGKRGLLRLLFLRHAVENPHLSQTDLQRLDQLLQFRQSARSYGQADLALLHSFEKKRDGR